jgi:hypothetical protein
MKYKWPINTSKTIQHPLPSEKYKLKLYWDSISPQSEWLLSGKQKTIVGEEVERKEYLHTIGGIINSYNECGCSPPKKTY